MQKIFKYIKDFYKEEAKVLYLILVMAMLAILIYFNYWHQLEKNIAHNSYKIVHLTGYYFLYFVPFATAFFLQYFFYKKIEYHKKIWFWLILFLGPAFFSFRINFDYHEFFIEEIWRGEKLQFWSKNISWIIRVFVLLIPVYIIWLVKDKNKLPFYGTKKLDDIKPYAWMLIIMIPLIALASTQKDFLEMYPRAKFLHFMGIGKDKWRYWIYELCYGFDFVSIEFFFRGFLILSLIDICGKHCITPAACFYCMIHFGKPMGEAISSFFGGMLLGIISYNTKSVWGGLMIHLGIAWLMEVGGWVGGII